jgi:hypothetical protein
MATPEAFLCLTEDAEILRVLGENSRDKTCPELVDSDVHANGALVGKVRGIAPLMEERSGRAFSCRRGSFGDPHNDDEIMQGLPERSGHDAEKFIWCTIRATRFVIAECFEGTIECARPQDIR